MNIDWDENDDENAKVMNIELIDNASLSLIAWLISRKTQIFFADIAYLNYSIHSQKKK
jgi:hypothetical protein